MPKVLFICLTVSSRCLVSHQERQNSSILQWAIQQIPHQLLFSLDATYTGPDVEFIEDILSQVGGRHAKMGVPVSLFPFLGNALIWAIQQDMKDELSDEHVEAWQEVFDEISGEIVKAILNAGADE